MSLSERHSCPRNRLEFWVVVAVLGTLAVQVWSNTPSILPAAVAQIPDTGLQRKQLIDEQRRTNDLLEQIVDVLRSKTIKVELAPSEKERGGGPRASGR